MVATVLTVYGIETLLNLKLLVCLYVATVLTVYGIETPSSGQMKIKLEMVATVLTVYGIETFIIK